LVPGTPVYGERLVQEGGQEFRAWNPRRSKLAALLLLLDAPLGIPEDASVLYLGAGTGTTVSHVSDLVPGGAVYAVEVAPRPFEKLLRLAQDRKNLVPIMGDAREVASYRDLVPEVDLLYQDVAQRNQTDILLRNLSFLQAGGLAILMLKARSVDVTAAPDTLFRKAHDDLEAAGAGVRQVVALAPYQKDHAALLLPRPGQTR
jgi:fibrillarin-like pre-rRNA processing protein